ncbi:pseudouridine synthase [Alphaproteobacteria bacterium]|nr:pseudouridine synthase [Alphaproteobacteria bacterium]
MSSTVRLNKFIATQTGISRREADEMISAGRVTIGTQTARLGQQISEADQIFVDRKLLIRSNPISTVAVNKPVGYLSSRRSQGGDPTVYDLLPDEYKALKTAGRLDKDSSGLVILSSDGDLIQRLTHPRHEKTKIYEIELDRPLEPLHRQMIADFGVDLADGKSRLGLEKRVKSGDEPGFTGPTTTWIVTMHEGRNRQIRRTFAALGYTVVKLHRTHLEPYALGDLKPGQWRKIA